MISVWTSSRRILVIAIGLLGISWGISEFAMFRREATISNIAKRIIAGDPFKPEILLDQASLPEQVENQATCRAVTVRSAAVIRLRLVEMSDNPRLSSALDRKNSAVDAIRKSLECSPADPFLWLVLFALEPSAPVSYLRMSYRLGPNEGWIAPKRNPVAFADFDELPEDLRGTVVQEFLSILEIDLYEEAMKIFVGPAWEKRELILSRIDHVSLRHRQNLARLLDAGGYDVNIPGTTLSTTH